MSNGKEHILAFIDAPDPDNFVQVIALSKLFPDADVHVVLTGRPVRYHATKDHQKWEWSTRDSFMAQQSSAARIKNFLRHFGVHVTRVFDGGIAPRTLVPHHVHFQEYYRFLDVDPLAAIAYPELEAQDELVKLILTFEPGSVRVAVGGPMTGLAQVIARHPEVVTRFKEVHAMFATWGKVELMQFGDAPRGASQFNVACDPQAAYQVLMGLQCPVYLMPTEVTRVLDIGFLNAQKLREFLPDNPGCRALYTLYALWYDAAVRPRQASNPNEYIFIHDLVAAFSLSEELRNAIYKVVPVEITSVPHLAHEQADWGKVVMKETTTPGNRFAAVSLTEGGAQRYLDALKKVLS